MEVMASAFLRGTYLLCSTGSHAAIYDDQQTYLNALVDFLSSDRRRQSNQEDVQ